jgi:hypothetical protein
LEPNQPLFQLFLILFIALAQAKSEGRGAYTIRVGILEIYNEEMKDLGTPTQAQRLHQGDLNRLQLKEDPILGIKVSEQRRV